MFVGTQLILRLLDYLIVVLVCNFRLWLFAVAGRPQQVGSGCRLSGPAIWRGWTKWPVTVSCCTGR